MASDRILLIDDDADLCALMADFFKENGLAVEFANDGRAGLSRALGEPFDLILLDAPCSASGTLRKHPELTWTGHGIDLDRLVRAQGDLLDAALPRLAAGGLLIYAVCSVFPEEGRAHLDRLRTARPNLVVPACWPEALGGAFFRPDLLAWDGEGFQAFALQA